MNPPYRQRLMSPKVEPRVAPSRARLQHVSGDLAAFSNAGLVELDVGRLDQLGVDLDILHQMGRHFLWRLQRHHGIDGQHFRFHVLGLGDLDDLGAELGDNSSWACRQRAKIENQMGTVRRP